MYKEIQKLEEILRSKVFPTRADYLQMSMNGEFDQSGRIDDFVGTQAQIAAELDRRKIVAKIVQASDYDDWDSKIAAPIRLEIYNLTISETPDSLKNAISYMYSMATKKSHSGGYSEVYNTYCDIVSDFEEVLKLVSTK